MKKIIFPYYQRFAKIFDREKNKISKMVKGFEVHHIGSTSVPGLGGKGIIDIMIAVKNWKDSDGIIKKLKNTGFKHIHPKEKGRIFLSKLGPTKLGDTHLHIVRKNGKPYKDLLSFRDYLRKNKKELKRFFRLKQQWEKEANGDRMKYNELKGGYVEEILRRATQIK